jgi:signal transduction histidine kinase
MAAETLRRRGASVRFRATMGATVVVGAALLVAAVALVLFLRRSLTEDVRLAARLRGEAVANLLVAGGPPALPIPLEDGEDEFVQVLNEDGAVVASSENIAGHPPVVRLAPGESEEVRVLFDDDPFLAVATSAGFPDRPYKVIAGRTLDPVLESSQAVVGLLVVGLPLLVLVVGLVTWRVVGRALAPVESIRGEVEAISSRELHRRVPVPRSGDEISRLAATMNRMLERLERGQERQRRFVSDASHELRSPVASIRQHAELALAHPANVSTRDLARTVLDEDLRVQRLVEDLLLLARMDERTAEARPHEVDLDDVVFKEVERLRQADGTTIDASGVSAGRVLGDGRRLSRLVGNLLENAARHARGTIRVTLAEERDQVVLRVDDDGPGIAPEHRQRVFERFVRLDEARDRDGGGAGLGLAIVAEVAALHGGEARVLESPLGGARFEVRLPRAAG